MEISKDNLASDARAIWAYETQFPGEGHKEAAMDLAYFAGNEADEGSCEPVEFRDIPVLGLQWRVGYADRLETHGSLLSGLEFADF